MAIKLLFFGRKKILKLSFVFLFLLSLNSYAQCAGNDASVTICDIENPIYQSVNLFDLLGGNPSTGGVWIDNSKPNDDNVFDGFLNVQKLVNSDIYTYTYVQNPSSCSDNEATVTLKIGPYVGTPSPNVSVCEDEDIYSLFGAFDGTKLPPLQNGVWVANDNSDTLNGSTIRPSVLREGNYSYTYTIPALDNCPEQSATILVSIFRKPKAGAPSNLILCSTDNLSNYNNLNLFNLLSDYDIGGKWTDASSTNQITTSSDNIIDVESIYNTYGQGTYSFTYTVLSSNPICTKAQTTVKIIIEDPLDFTGATLNVNSDICEDEITTKTYSAILTRGIKNIPNGNYDVTYSISNGTTTEIITQDGTFNNGTFNFTINRSKLPAVGKYTFTVLNIVYKASIAFCTNIIGTITDDVTIFPLPNINNATVKIDPICSGFDAEVEISGNTNLKNGDYIISYTLSGNNTANNQELKITVDNGVALFKIPSNLITNTGDNTTIKIINITDVALGCSNVVNLSKVFTIKATPDVSGISVNINNECLEGDTIVELSGLGNVTNVALHYSLTGANIVSNQFVNAEVNSGKASCIIPKSILQNIGTTNFTLNSLDNISNSCSAVVTDNVTASFTLENCNLFIPDGFSPNGDGINDVFRIQKIEFIYPDFALEIYNRYGNLLFKGTRDKLEWNGRNSDYQIGIDGITPNGVYFYILHYNKENKKPLQGRLYLNR